MTCIIFIQKRIECNRKVHMLDPIKCFRQRGVINLCFCKKSHLFELSLYFELRIEFFVWRSPRRAHETFQGRTNDLRLALRGSKAPFRKREIEIIIKSQIKALRTLKFKRRRIYNGALYTYKLQIERTSSFYGLKLYTTSIFRIKNFI